MKVTDVRMLKIEPRSLSVGEIFISEGMADKLEESIASGYITYYKITKVDEVKRSYVYEPCYESVEEG